MQNNSCVEKPWFALPKAYSRFGSDLVCPVLSLKNSPLSPHGRETRELLLCTCRGAFTAMKNASASDFCIVVPEESLCILFTTSGWFSSLKADMEQRLLWAGSCCSPSVSSRGGEESTSSWVQAPASGVLQFFTRCVLFCCVFLNCPWSTNYWRLQWLTCCPSLIVKGIIITHLEMLLIPLLCTEKVTSTKISSLSKR